MTYFVGTEKLIMINNNEIESLEIDGDYLYIGFKSGNNVRLKVDVKSLMEVKKVYDFYLYNKKDIETYNKINELSNELGKLKFKYEKCSSDGHFSYVDYKSMNEIDRSRYEFLEESIKKLKYSFEN